MHNDNLTQYQKDLADASKTFTYNRAMAREALKWHELSTKGYADYINKQASDGTLTEAERVYALHRAAEARAEARVMTDEITRAGWAARRALTDKYNVDEPEEIPDATDSAKAEELDRADAVRFEEMIQEELINHGAEDIAALCSTSPTVFKALYEAGSKLFYMDSESHRMEYSGTVATRRARARTEEATEATTTPPELRIAAEADAPYNNAKEEKGA